ncbi:MAG: hypothetical protein AAF696_24480 [Bacteroidota bacterium]
MYQNPFIEVGDYFAGSYTIVDREKVILKVHLGSGSYMAEGAFS